EDDVVEDVLGRLAEVDDPLAKRRRLDAVGHLLRVAGAHSVVVAADAADAARDEMRVAGVLAPHEDRVAPEHGRLRLAGRDLLVLEVDLGVDPEVPDDAGDRVPGHVDELAGLRFDALTGDGHVTVPPLLVAPAGFVTGGQLGSLVPPLGLLVHRLVGDAAQLAHHRPVHAAYAGRDAATRRGVHERHEPVGEARHRASDAD